MTCHSKKNTKPPQKQTKKRRKRFHSPNLDLDEITPELGQEPDPWEDFCPVCGCYIEAGQDCYECGWINENNDNAYQYEHERA